MKKFLEPSEADCQKMDVDLSAGGVPVRLIDCLLAASLTDSDSLTDSLTDSLIFSCYRLHLYYFYICSINQSSVPHSLTPAVAVSPCVMCNGCASYRYALCLCLCLCLCLYLCLCGLQREA